MTSISRRKEKRLLAEQAEKETDKEAKKKKSEIKAVKKRYTRLNNELVDTERQIRFLWTEIHIRKEPYYPYLKLYADLFKQYIQAMTVWAGTSDGITGIDGLKAIEKGIEYVGVKAGDLVARLEINFLREHVSELFQITEEEIKNRTKPLEQKYFKLDSQLDEMEDEYPDLKRKLYRSEHYKPTLHDLVNLEKLTSYATFVCHDKVVALISDDEEEE